MAGKAKSLVKRGRSEIICGNILMKAKQFEGSIAHYHRAIMAFMSAINVKSDPEVFNISISVYRAYALIESYLPENVRGSVREACSVINKYNTLPLDESVSEDDAKLVQYNANSVCDELERVFKRMSVEVLDMEVFTRNLEDE